jgi:hypothetical protein
VPGLPQPEVAVAIEPATPAVTRAADPGVARSATLAARRRIALFLLVLLAAGAAAWGAGRLLSQTIEPAPMDPGMHHQMMPGMSGMPDMPGMSG